MNAGIGHQLRIVMGRMSDQLRHLCERPVGSRNIRESPRCDLIPIEHRLKRSLVTRIAVQIACSAIRKGLIAQSLAQELVGKELDHLCNTCSVGKARSPS